MKATVWTSASNPKCIFDGDIQSVPRVGDLVVVRDGFASCRVTDVTHDFVIGEIEIKVATIDYYNEYGACLRNSKED